MASRFTTTEKWKDSWYLSLSVKEKLLFNFICDNCDNAGFWEINLPLAGYLTGISKGTILGAYQGLSRAYIEHDGYIWLRKYIFHQKNLPLNPDNNAHKQILLILESHSDWDVNFFEEMKKNRGSLGSNKAPCKGKVKVKQPPLYISLEKDKIQLTKGE